MSLGKKTLIIIIATTMLVLTLSGCLSLAGNNSAPAPKESSLATAATTSEDISLDSNKVKIAVAIPQGETGFWAESEILAKEELVALALQHDYEYKIDTSSNQQDQIAALNSFIDWKAQVIILCPLDSEALRATAQKVIDSGIKLIIYDRMVDQLKPTAEIQGDNTKIGQWTGEYMLTYFPEEIATGQTLSYLRFVGDDSSVSAQRLAGLEAAFDAFDYTKGFVPASCGGWEYSQEAADTATSQFKLLSQDFKTDWSGQKAQAQMENWLETTPEEDIKDLDFIVTQSDDMVRGILVALKNYKASHPEAVLELKLITGVGADQEAQALFDQALPYNIDVLTYLYSPSFIREAIKLGVAAAYDQQYEGKSIHGQRFLIPTFEINKKTIEDFRREREDK